MCEALTDKSDQAFDGAGYLRERFKHDVCLDCGRDADGHTVGLDRYGDPVVTCDDEDRLAARASNRRWMLGYLR